MAASLSRRAYWMQKIAEEVARGVRAQISDGRLAAGAVLPDREALAAEYVTSLTAVDRALDLLAGEGWVELRDDGTAYAAQPPRGEQGFEVPEGFATRKEDVVAVLELRMGVEVVAAASAASKRSEAALSALRDAMDAYAAAVDKRDGIAQADFQFHRAVARASGNAYIVDLIDYLGPLLIPRMRLNMPAPDGDGADAILTQSLREHREICDAIERRDPDAAGHAMKAHLSRSIALIGKMA